MTATHPTFLLYAGDTWEFDAALHDNAGAALNLTGAAVIWRLRDAGQTIKAELSVGDGIVLSDAGNGLCRITLPPEKTTPLNPGSYTDEIRVTLADGFVTTQAVGKIEVRRLGSSGSGGPIANLQDTTDPCVALAVLRQARIDLLTGQRTVSVKIGGDVSVTYSETNMASLQAAIIEYDALCAKQRGAQPRRFAMRLGPQR